MTRLPAIRTLEVTTSSRSRRYPIYVHRGGFGMLGARLAQHGFSRVFVLSSDTVLRAIRHDVASLRQQWAHSGVDLVALHCVPDGEAAKTWEVAGAAIETVLSYRPTRSDAVVALGGGTVGDLAGFVAAVVLRGLAVVQVPTTLLAQVDASVGGKTGLNSRTHGKNLIGAFHQPTFVLIDPAFLSTLDKRDCVAGYAEILKAALLKDAAFFAQLESTALLAQLHTDLGQDLLCAAIAIKAEIVAGDEREQSQRAWLNLGHTFAHGLEAIAGFHPSTLRHGEAVLIGLVLAAGLSRAVGKLPQNAYDRILAHFRARALPTHPADFGMTVTPDTLIEAMQSDKKRLSDRLRFILLQRIGQAVIDDTVTHDQLAAFLKEQLP